MPGPMSAPNGDRRIAAMPTLERMKYVDSKRWSLTTGKTRKKREKEALMSNI